MPFIASKFKACTLSTSSGALHCHTRQGPWRWQHDAIGPGIGKRLDIVCHIHPFVGTCSVYLANEQCQVLPHCLADTFESTHKPRGCYTGVRVAGKYEEICSLLQRSLSVLQRRQPAVCVQRMQILNWLRVMPTGLPIHSFTILKVNPRPKGNFPKTGEADVKASPGQADHLRILYIIAIKPSDPRPCPPPARH